MFYSDNDQPSNEEKQFEEKHVLKMLKRKQNPIEKVPRERRCT